MMRYGKYLVPSLLLLTASGCHLVITGLQEDAERREAAELRKAAEAGDAEAQLGLGVCYYNGTGVPKKLVEANAWFRKAADQGHMKGQYALGQYYVNGEGMQKDVAQATEWFRKAAEQGHVGAQGNLGLIYSDCENVHDNCDDMTKDIPQAIAWFERAANQGDDFSMAMLGALYAHSNEIPKDLVSAYMWCNLATKHGWDAPDLAKLMDEISKKMTPEQMAEAKQRVDAFVVVSEAAGE